MFNIPDAAFWQDIKFDQMADCCRVSSGVDTVGIGVFVGPGGEESIDSNRDVAVGRGIEVDEDNGGVGCGVEVDVDSGSDSAKMLANTISVTAIVLRRIRR